MATISDRIIERLQMLDENPSEIKPFMIDYLNKVDEYIQDIENNQKQAIEALKLKDLNVSAISNLLGTSRTTPYNHNALIKRYMDISEVMLRSDNPLDQMKLLEVEIDKLKREVEMLYDRDITVEIQKQKSRVLSDKLKEKKLEIERLEARNRELSLENQKLKRISKSNSSQNNVTELNRKR